MNGQLTVGDILNVVNGLKELGIKLSEIKKMPVYIGNDDELNGIHTAWYINVLNENDEGDNADLIEMINEDHHNIKFANNAFLIS